MELEGQTDLFGETIEHFAVGGGRIGEQSPHFCSATEEHGGFEADHFEIFGLCDITARLEIDIILLSFANLNGAVGEKSHHFVRTSDGALRNEAIGEEQHGVARKHGGVFVPALVDGRATAAHIGVVHEVIVHEGVVVVHLDADGGRNSRGEIAVIERVGRE